MLQRVTPPGVVHGNDECIDPLHGNRFAAVFAAIGEAQSQRQFEPADDRPGDFARGMPQYDDQTLLITRRV